MQEIRVACKEEFKNTRVMIVTWKDRKNTGTIINQKEQWGMYINKYTNLVEGEVVDGKIRGVPIITSSHNDQWHHDNCILLILSWWSRC